MAEKASTGTAAKSNAPAQEEPVVDSALVAYYKASGTPYCERCGQQIATDSGKVICNIGVKDCPVM
jgi:hypothetical protein